ncbi:UNVERIFIED_CONTAM: hypothetical protein K2H54_071778 [Gekko kuhli]
MLMSVPDAWDLDDRGKEEGVRNRQLAKEKAVMRSQRPAGAAEPKGKVTIPEEAVGTGVWIKSRELICDRNHFPWNRPNHQAT